MKRIISLALILVLILLLCSCSVKENASYSNTDVNETILEHTSEGSLVEGYTFYNAMDDASEIFEGVCIKIEASNELARADMTVSVSKVYRGSITEGDTLNVTGNDIEFYKEDARYIFFTTKYASVYSGKPLYYFASCPIRIIEGGGCQAVLPELNGLSYDEISAKIFSYTTDHQYKGDPDLVVGAYCDSDDLREVIAYSDIIAVVKADEIFTEGGDRTCYSCIVVSTLKGTILERVTVIAFKNGMDIGEEYLVMLMSSENDAYLLSSAHSLAKIGTAEADTILSLLKE